eukprot:4996826-Pyramimonas_sp.AAC.1
MPVWQQPVYPSQSVKGAVYNDDTTRFFLLLSITETERWWTGYFDTVQHAHNVDGSRSMGGDGHSARGIASSTGKPGNSYFLNVGEMGPADTRYYAYNRPVWNALLPPPLMIGYHS